MINEFFQWFGMIFLLWVILKVNIRINKIIDRWGKNDKNNIPL